MDFFFEPPFVTSAIFRAIEGEGVSMFGNKYVPNGPTATSLAIRAAIPKQTELFDHHVPGGKLCLSLSALSESFRTRV